MTRFGRIRLTVADQAKRHAWAALGMWFYVEAAALLRLAPLPFVPKLRGLDIGRHEVCMDYLPGENLRQLAAAQGQPVYDVDVGADPGLAAFSAGDLTAREVRLVDGAGLGNYRAEVGRMIAAMNEHGVAPLDIKPGNLLRGERTKRFYWLDFERARLASQPRWEAQLRTQNDLLREVFGELRCNLEPAARTSRARRARAVRPGRDSEPVQLGVGVEHRRRRIARRDLDPASQPRALAAAEAPPRRAHHLRQLPRRRARAPSR